MKGKKIKYIDVEDFYTKMVMFGFSMDIQRFEEITNIVFENRPVEKKIQKVGFFQSSPALCHHMGPAITKLVGLCPLNHTA